ERVGEFDKFAREGDLGRGDGRGVHAGQRLGRGVQFAKYGVNARDGVEQVGGGVAFEGDHLVPREQVVAGAVLRQVGVLHRADSDDLGDQALFLRREVGVAGGDETVGAFDGLVEQVLELDVFTVAGLERTAV